jgi:hypothetical protein
MLTRRTATVTISAPDAARVDAQLGEQGGDGQWSGEFVRLAIQSDTQLGSSVPRRCGGVNQSARHHCQITTPG